MGRVIDTILAAEKIAVYIHINVDCDAMGSALAFKEALEQKGKIVDIYDHSMFPENFAFYGDFDFVNKKHIEGKYDLAVCLDTANESRIGKYKFTYRKNCNGNTLLIDHHHLISERFCKINYVREASSTCEILYSLFKEIGVEFTSSICKYLISGILTDTGKFMHSTSSKTLIIASRLLELGNLKMDEITDALLNSMSMNLFSMIRLAYQKIEFYSENQFALIMFSHDEFIQNGLTIDDIDVVPDIPLQIRSVKFAIIASEDDKGYFRVSFRSKGDVSSLAVAETFGGGGHFNASGCKIFGEFDEVKQKLIDNTLLTLGWSKWLKNKLVL